MLNCEKKFEQLYKREPESVAFCPYRICPIGAHIDHQHGKITGLAINEGVHIAYSVKHNGVIELSSMQFEKRAQWHISSVPKEKENDWADYLRGATYALSQKYRLKVGVCGVVEGSIPIGGLSSSAAVIISFLSALCKVNDIKLSEYEMVMTALKAENEYVGVACGKLDQSCEVYSKKDHLLYLDTKDDSFELISTSPNMKPYKIAIFFSGVERKLAGSAYNTRVDECRAAAFSLKAFEGIEYGKFKETYLRDVPLEVYLKHKDKLPENFAKRAEHWYSEMERVEKGAEAWRRGDIEEYGRLSFESGKSSIFKYETGSPELQGIYDIMTKTDGIYGGRFQGAGFKGCCMALFDPSFEESIVKKVTTEYLEKFPQYKDKFSVHICESSDGVKL